MEKNYINLSEEDQIKRVYKKSEKSNKNNIEYDNFNSNNMVATYFNCI